MNYLRAYQAYQDKNYDLCLKLLDSNDDIQNLDLRAQALLRKKDYQAAHDTYLKIIDSYKKDKLNKERHENILVIVLCAQLEGYKLKTKHKCPPVDEIVSAVQSLQITDESLELKLSPSTKRPRHKKRKKRLPKVFDAIAGPDPERWLPRHERSKNKGKKRDKKSKQRNKGKK